MRESASTLQSAADGNCTRGQSRHSIYCVHFVYSAVQPRPEEWTSTAATANAPTTASAAAHSTAAAVAAS